MRRSDSLEIERYELFEDPFYRFKLDRRQFMKIFGGGVVLLVPFSRIDAQQGESGRRGRSQQDIPQEIGAWIHIDESGAIKVFTGKVEIGQNTRTSLTQAVADELRVQPSTIEMVMADTDRTPFDMGTFGSLSTPRMAPQLRKAAAAVREFFMDLAAKQWNVPRERVLFQKGTFVNGSSSLTFADLAKGQKIAQVIREDVAVTPVSQWTIAGTSLPKVNGRDFVTGKHKYTSDMKLPGMLIGMTVRPSSFEATIVSADISAARSIPGVIAVHDGDFLGVAAPDRETAAKAVKQIHVEWKASPQPSNAELNDVLLKPASGQRESRRREPTVQGSVQSGLAAAHKTLEQQYTVAYIAHVPLEPRAALAEWKADKLTVWTGTQRPFGVRAELAETFRIPEQNVRVIVPDTGSGYGGKHTGECAIEAARLARAAHKPVKIVWSREEEFTWAYFRPAGVIRVKSGIRKDGVITAWEFHNHNSGSSAMEMKYDVPNLHIEFHPSDSPLRQGSYRALAATANHFARETHMDELAHSIQMDRLDFRVKNTKDERIRGVLEAAAKAFGWRNRKPAPGHGFGIACGFEKDSYVAACAEIALPRKSGESQTRPLGTDLKIVRVVESFECGAVVNPNHLKNQIEGAIVQGLGGALFEQIRFGKGKILNPHLAQYRVPRFSDLPPIEVVIVNRKDLPSEGAGETPIVGIAPAIGNAIFHATGTRLRSLPLLP